MVFARENLHPPIRARRSAAAPPWWLRLEASLVAAVFALPFVYLVARNLAGGSAFGRSVSSVTALGAMARSVALAVAVTASAAVLGTAAAWLVARTDVPGRRILRVLLPLPLVIPSFIGAFVLLAAFAPGGALASMLQGLGLQRLPSVRGFLGAFVVLSVLTYPYVYMPMLARLRRLPPSLEESARLLGARGTAAFARVVMPQAKDALVAGAMLVFLYTISDFGVVQLMRYDALTRVIYATRLFDRSFSLALSLHLGILALAVVTVERIARRAPVRVAAHKAGSPLIVRLGGWRLSGFAYLTGLVGVSLGVPTSVLAWWTVRGVAAGGGAAVNAGLSDVLVSLVNTAIGSVAAAALAVVALAPVAYLGVRHRSRAAEVANAVVVAGFALPGLAIALSLVSFTVSAPAWLPRIYQTLPLLLVAYVVHFGAQALRAGQVAVAAVPARVEDAARVLGVGRWARIARVELPLMAPGLVAGGGLVLLSAMKELPATLLLAPAGFQTLAMDIWQATESAYFTQAAVASLVLIALSGLLTWLLVIRRDEAVL